MSNLKLKSIKPKPEMFYDIKKLSLVNEKYNRLFGVRNFDTDKINKVIVTLINKLSSEKPEIGDKVIIEVYSNSGKNGIAYSNGHIESLNYGDTGKLNICTSPDVPHIRENGNTSTSGGYWVQIDQSELSFVGYDSKQFWTWGFEGQKGDAGLYFKAPVKVWSYKDFDVKKINLIKH